MSSQKNSPKGRKSYFSSAGIWHLTANGKDYNALPSPTETCFSIALGKGAEKKYNDKQMNKQTSEWIPNGRKMKYPKKSPRATEDPVEFRQRV